MLVHNAALLMREKPQAAKAASKLQAQVAKEADALLRELACVLRWTAKVKQSIAETAKLN